MGPNCYGIWWRRRRSQANPLRMVDSQQVVPGAALTQTHPIKATCIAATPSNKGVPSERQWRAGFPAELGSFCFLESSIHAWSRPQAPGRASLSVAASTLIGRLYEAVLCVHVSRAGKVARALSRRGAQEPKPLRAGWAAPEAPNELTGNESATTMFVQGGGVRAPGRQNSNQSATKRGY